MADCLQAAGLSPSDLCAVKTHGSGGSSDDTEAAVLADLLPEVPAILLKPYTSHTLGATAALESALLLLALRRHRSRLHFAHSDLSGYSVFEEAVYWGVEAAKQILAQP